MIDTVLFDLGNTLVRYYTASEFPPILERALREVASRLLEDGVRVADHNEITARAAAENYEAQDLCVRPLSGRLQRIFSLDPENAALLDRVEQAFMRPIFALAQRYGDAIPTLDTLRTRGYRIGIVSNTPWGSPAGLWREELDRWDLGPRVGAACFCADVGMRKPAAPIFRHALEVLGSTPERAVFVGDDPRWDIIGPTRIGMRAILLDRTGAERHSDAFERIATLHELHDRLHGA